MPISITKHSALNEFTFKRFALLVCSTPKIAVVDSWKYPKSKDQKEVNCRKKFRPLFSCSNDFEFPPKPFSAMTSLSFFRNIEDNLLTKSCKIDFINAMIKLNCFEGLKYHEKAQKF